MSVDPKFVELTADVLEIFFIKCETTAVYLKGATLPTEAGLSSPEVQVRVCPFRCWPAGVRAIT